MDFTELSWLFSREHAIDELRASQKASSGRNAVAFQRLQEENHELRIRIGVLIRLLIERGIFSADDFASLVNDTKKRLRPVKPKPALNRPSAGARPRAKSS